MADSAQTIQPGSVYRATYATAKFGGALVSDWTHGVPSAINFFPPRTWREVCAEIDVKKYPRSELSKVLETASRDLGASEISRANARALNDEKTYAVVTGQQAGFCGGPLFTIYKALTAVKLAKQYEQEAGGAARFIPVFWVAGDDHDLAEINHAYFLKEDGTSLRVSAPLEKSVEGRSACNVSLALDAEQSQALQRELEPLIGANETAAILSAYGEGNLEFAFGKTLTRWLSKTGLVIAPSSAMRQFSADTLARNLDDFDVPARLIQEAGVAMKRCLYDTGFSEQLRIAPHFFAALGLEKIRTAVQIEMRDGERGFRIGDATFSHKALTDLIHQHPEYFSSSAALRPVFQDALFPTAAVVLGPGEIAYWAQLRKVHEHYSAPWPVVVPRASITLLDPLGEKAVRKLGLNESSSDIFLTKEELLQRAIQGGELSAKISARKTAILGELGKMHDEVNTIEPALLSMLEKVREKFEHELTRFEERAGAEADKRGEAKTVRAAYLAGLVSPRSGPQERILCAAQFIAKYPDLIDRLMENIDPDQRSHLVMTL